MARGRIPVETEERVRRKARYRCGYCLSPQHLAMARMEIEHIVPRAQGGQDWFEHFEWSSDGLRIVGLTAVGRATVVALHLSDDSDALIVRSHWVLAGWHPPTE